MNQAGDAKPGQERRVLEHQSTPASVMTDKRARAVLLWLFEAGNRQLGEWVYDVGAVEVVERLSREDGPEGLVSRARSMMEYVDFPRVEHVRDMWECAAHLARQTGEAGLRFITPEDAEWPDQVNDLQELSDTWSPLGLWLRGDSDVRRVCEKAVAVVGARASSDYGDFVARELGYGLARSGFTTISGAAFGIDAAAHRGTLAADGVTVAVLANGADVPYPAAHQNLLDRVREAGGMLLSEHPPGAHPTRHRFLIRNRVIAALTQGVVIVEAAIRSGSLVTARRAGALGRPVMAVPGSITNVTSEGSHDMIRNAQAELVTSAEQVIEHVSPIGEGLCDPPISSPTVRDLLGSHHQAVLDAFPSGESATVEALVAETGVDRLRLDSILAELVRGAWVTHEGDGWHLAPRARNRSGVE